MNIEKELELLQKQESVELDDGDLGDIKKFKKKKKTLTDRLSKVMNDSIFNTDDSEYSAMVNLAEDIKKAKKKKGKEIVFDSESFLNDSEESGKKKHKDLVKRYEGQFKSQKALLTKLLSDTDKDTKVIREVFMNLCSNGSTRGVMGKVATDFASALVSSNANKLNIIKHLTDLTKISNELAFKEESRYKGDDEGSLDQESLGTMALRSLFSQGNSEVIKALQETSSLSQNEYDKIQSLYSNDGEKNEDEFYTGSILDSDGNTKSIKPVERESVDFDPHMQERLDELNNEYQDDIIYGRSKAGDNLIKNESRDVKIKIRRWVNSEGEMDYEFIAIDKDGLLVDDYEVPDKRMEKISWNDETGFAKDSKGRIYAVIDE